MDQPQVLAYLQHVVDRHDLRQYMQFNTEMQGASWDNAQNVWIVSLSSGEKLTSRYLVTAIGLLSKKNYPEIPGIHSFKGEMYHTGSWPASHDFSNKRVGVIGSGSTGVQLVTALSSQAKHLISFQRNPQYVVPARNKEVSPENRDRLNKRWQQTWSEAKHSMFGFGFKESIIPTFSVDDEERERIFEEAWEYGSGFYFMFGTFCDISYNEEANKAAADFIRRKIQQRVNDPVKAQKLMPTGWFARRPLCDTDYYEKFNQSNVDIVNVKSNPITKFTDNSICTADGTVHELDVIILATGFDAVDGNYKRIPIYGASGQSLKNSWIEEPKSYLGVSTPDFPNLLMILGPNGPFTNLPPLIEVQVEFIADLIAQANKSSLSGRPRIEADPEAMVQWCQTCDELSAGSLFRKTDSWIFGANVPGKKKTVLFYFGGLANYRNVLEEVTKKGYKGLKFNRSD